MEVFFGIFAGLVGLFVGFVVLLLVAPFFKGKLMNNPAFPDKFALFTEVEPGRAKIKMRGGRVVGIIRGKQRGEQPEWTANVLWSVYQKYIYRFIGMYVIGVPFIQKVYTYKLPRYRAIEADGKKEYKVVPEGDAGFRTDHVRNELTTWYFQFSGAEVDTIPMTVKGSVQIRIEEGRELDALFKTDSWNVLLDQALNSVIRGIMRAKVSLDQIIGAVSQEIWSDAGTHDDTYEVARSLLWEGLKSYKIMTSAGEKTLAELIGLVIERVDIIDFSPDLPEDKLTELSAPALSRQAARGRSIAGKGEAEYQKTVLEAINTHPELAKENVWAEAFVKAAGKGSLDALAAGLLKKLSK